MADQDEQANATSQKKCWDRLKKCRDSLIKIGEWPLFAKIAVWVILALIVFFLVTTGLSGDGVLRFMKYLGRGAEPIRITTTALTMIGGIGAVGYLVIKYQERTAAQRAEQREQRGEQRAIARQQADELLDAIHLLGDDKASTRVAGVQSLVQIGQGRPEIRQRIIDILCGYLRTDRDNDGAVESTILTTLHEHLIPRGPFTPLFWKNINLDLRNSMITEPIDLSGIVCRTLDMSEAHVDSTTRPNFRKAQFTLNANFRNITCGKGMDFSYATFGLRIPHFGADFSNSKLQHYEFMGATFGNVDFTHSYISDCHFLRARLYRASFSNSNVYKTSFSSALLSQTWFDKCKFSDVSFQHAEFPDSTSFNQSSFDRMANFRRCKVSRSLLFDDACFGPEGHEAWVLFDGAQIFGSISAEDAQNNAWWSFKGTHFLKSAKNAQTQFPDSMRDSTGQEITFVNAIFDLD